MMKAITCSLVRRNRFNYLKMVFDSLQITDSIESAARIRTPWTLEKQGIRVLQGQTLVNICQGTWQRKTA